MKKKFLAVVTLGFAAVLAFALAGCGSSDSSSSGSGNSGEVSDNLNFVTGGESGTYYAFGTVLANYCTNNGGPSITALSGNGSQANVQALQDGDADMAFCQSDVLSYAYNGTNLFKDDGAYKDFSVVAALYPETVQIVTTDSSIKSVADLKGKTVSIGATGSGVNFNARDILGAYGIDVDKDINPIYQDFGDSTDSLKNGKVDAAFIVAGAPTPAVTDLGTSKKIHLVSLDDSHVKKLMKDSPYYTEQTIKKDVYNTDSDTTTVAVQAVIIANNNVSEDAIYNFTKSIFDGAKAQPEAHDKYKEINLKNAASIEGVPYHPGAAKYFKEQGQKVSTSDK